MSFYCWLNYKVVFKKQTKCFPASSSQSCSNHASLFSSSKAPSHFLYVTLSSGSAAWRVCVVVLMAPVPSRMQPVDITDGLANLVECLLVLHLSVCQTICCFKLPRSPTHSLCCGCIITERHNNVPEVSCNAPDAGTSAEPHKNIYVEVVLRCPMKLHLGSTSSSSFSSCCLSLLDCMLAGAPLGVACWNISSVV